MQTDNTLSLLTNNGTGGFVLVTNYPVGYHPQTIIAADVNGEGKTDLICDNAYANTLSVLTNDGSGGFVLAGTYPDGNAFGANGGPADIVAADVNGDGKPDLICSDYDVNLLTVLLNTSVNPVPVLTNILVSPPNAIIGVGSNQQFNATGYYNDGSFQILTNGGLSGGGWVAIAGLPSAKTTVASANVNGKLYVVGGSDGNLYAYNPASNTWTNRAPFPNTWCNDSGAAGIGNKLYIMGGCGDGDCNNGLKNWLTVYDAVADSWSNAAPMKLARCQMSTAVINGKIYVVGGDNGHYQTLNSFEVYDPTTNGWAIETMPFASGYGATVEINGQLYLVGGLNADMTIVGTLEVYNPTNDSWVAKSPMPTPRIELGAVAVNGLLYAIGGQTATGTDKLGGGI